MSRGLREERIGNQGSDLTREILRFCQALRRHKVGVTVENALDVLRGISSIDVGERGDFYHLLKFNLVSHREEMKIFDDLFEQFWSRKEGAKPLVGKGDEGREASGKAREVSPLEGSLQAQEEGEGSPEKAQSEPPSVVAYSPDEVLRQKNFGNLETEELQKLREWVIALSRKLAGRLSRRWKRGRRRDRLDLRRSIRHSIRYGGELVELRKKGPKPKPPELLFLCDVSGSMDIYTQFVLLFTYGVQNAYSPCETFVFSTRLSRITSLLKRKTFEEALSLLSRKVLDWSGGTNIGAALHELREHHGDRLKPGRTIVFVFSDGWDRGETAHLDWEMRNLKREVRRLIWLNPLKGSRHYEPLCRGMATVLPYLDDFLPCHNFESLHHLVHLLP